MIRKPAEGWGRESAAVGAMRTAAEGGKAAVQTGGRLLRGIMLCGVGSIFLFGALAGGLLGGSIPSLIGCGGVAALLIGSGMRVLKPAAAPAASPAAPPTFGAAAHEPANTVSYSRERLFAQAGVGVLFLLLSLWGLGSTGGALRFAVVIMIPVFGLMTVASLRRAFGDLTALRWDRQGVTVAGLMSKPRTVAWSQVRSVDVEQINTYAYGFLKVASRKALTIRLSEGPLFGRRLSLSPYVLQLDGRTVESLALMLQAAQLGRSAPSTAFTPPPTAQAPQFAAPPPRPAPPRYEPPAAQPAQFAAPAAPAAPRYEPPAPDHPVVYGNGPARATFGRRGL